MKNATHRKPSRRKSRLMPAWQRYLSYTGLLGCSVTGLAYLLGHTFEYGAYWLGLHYWVVAHGLFAMLALIVFGAVLPIHIKTGLALHKNRVSGFLQLALALILAMTGGLLYYGAESIRDVAIQIHWAFGLVFILALCAHLTHLYLKKL